MTNIETFKDKAYGYAITIQVWPEEQFSPPRYASQVSCPVEKCDEISTIINKMSKTAAKIAVKQGLKQHMRWKHGK